MKPYRPTRDPWHDPRGEDCAARRRRMRKTVRQQAARDARTQAADRASYELAEGRDA